jgi:Ca2+/Na+ antiporter
MLMAFIPKQSLLLNGLIIIIFFLIFVVLMAVSYSYGCKILEKQQEENNHREFTIIRLNESEKEKYVDDIKKPILFIYKMLVIVLILMVVFSTLFIVFSSAIFTFLLSLMMMMALIITMGLKPLNIAYRTIEEFKNAK